MKKTALLVLLLISVCASLQAGVYPQLPLGGGYEVTIIVTSRVSGTFNGSLLLRQGHNEDWSTPYWVNGQPGTGSIAVTLPPNGSAKYVLTGGAETHVGYITTWGSDPYDAGGMHLAFFYNYSSQGHLVDSTGIPISTLQKKQIFPVERSATVNTAFAWAIDTGDSFPVTATLYNSAGQQVQQKVVTFQGHTAVFISEFFDNVPATFVGQVRLEAPDAPWGLGVAVLRLDLTRLQLTSTPPMWVQ